MPRAVDKALRRPFLLTRAAESERMKQVHESTRLERTRKYRTSLNDLAAQREIGALSFDDYERWTS